ncbi:hypothetical protein OLZ33_21300 [Pantoea ananatis]|uniref:hypothetical protein n=1 Tax=Pantoea ananas TaxID=553 RepID=UPI0022233B4E|nr:hypothetical protein [Pantoea ananatis]MCW1834510.1 hypothetical protein [Pantoea ananatis]
MTQQQMTEEQIHAVANRLGGVMARSEKPLKNAGWLMKLPEDELAEQTAALVKSLPDGWQPRIQQLQEKMLAWVEAKKAEAAATKSVEALRQSQATTEQAGVDNRARFRELLEQNGGTVTPEMKALRAEYLEQQETAAELAGLITQREKQLPGLGDVAGQKAHAYITCHERIMDERIDALIDEFFIVHGVELTSLLRMKYSQFERDGSPHAPGVLEGANDADTLYRGYIMNLILSWTNTKLPLMFRDDVISLAGPYPFRGAWQDRRKRQRFPGQK